MTEREAFVALNMAQGIGAAAAFFNAGASELARVRGLSHTLAPESNQETERRSWRACGGCRAAFLWSRLGAAAAR